MSRMAHPAIKSERDAVTAPKNKKVIFVCNQCGYQSSKWLGKCPDCGGWDTLSEEIQTNRAASAAKNVSPARPLTQTSQAAVTRLVTGIGELDRVLGGGIVPGSVTLIGGDPGIGKSTIILQLLSALAADNKKVLYVTGEESAEQIRMRADRLAISQEQIYLATENCVESIVNMSDELKPALLAVDSIQTMYTEEVASTPGGVTQVRESTARLLAMAKGSGLPVILIGHVTKDGALAGPRVLEHMVDTVLYFEGDRGQIFRILRTVKNRFGSTNEIGVFEMKESGLAEVENPSALFLSERPVNVPGSVVLPSVEGTRPILVEVQALVSPSSLGTARRTAIGADPQRLSLLTAVLEKKLGVTLYDHDIFLNIAGGIRIDEPALDLGVVVALLSSLHEKPVAPDTVVCGEVGLAGEVRAVGNMDMRVREAERLGFKTFLMPASNKQLQEKTSNSDVELIGVQTVQDVFEQIFHP